MINSQAMKNRRLKIVYMNGISNDIVREFICLSVAKPWLDSPARHPNRKASRMMITTIILLGQFSLTINRSPKLASPDHQRIIKKPPLFQIGNERATWLIDITTLLGNMVWQVAMLVPASVIELYEPNISLSQTSS